MSPLADGPSTATAPVVTRVEAEKLLHELYELGSRELVSFLLETAEAALAHQRSWSNYVPEVMSDALEVVKRWICGGPAFDLGVRSLEYELGLAADFSPAFRACERALQVASRVRAVEDEKGDRHPSDKSRGVVLAVGVLDQAAKAADQAAHMLAKGEGLSGSGARRRGRVAGQKESERCRAALAPFIAHSKVLAEERKMARREAALAPRERKSFLAA